MILDRDDAIRSLLEGARTVAVVGASSNPARPSYGVFQALRRRYEAAPINPTLQDVDGVPAFPTLEAYRRAKGAPPDVVDVFRNPADAPAVVDEAIAAGAKAIWFQLGVVNDAAIAAADQAGLDVVVDRCMKVEVARLLS